MKTRDITELLLLVKNKLKEYNLLPTKDFNRGMCFIVAILEREGKITGNEYMILIEYIYKNKPLKARLINYITTKFDYYPTRYDYIYSDHFFKRGHIKPRMKWLNRHIFYRKIINIISFNTKK